MKSIKSKLLISVMALAIAVTLATATTFAWFSMGSVATVRGIDLEIATEGDIRISLVNTKDYRDYATWGYSINLSTSDRLLQPVTIAKDYTNLPATKVNGVYRNADATGDYALNMLLRDGSNTADKTNPAGTKDFFKQELYLASPYGYEVTMDALDLGSDEVITEASDANATLSATSYHYVVFDDDAEIYRVAFFYNDVNNNYMIEDATGKTYEIVFEWDNRSTEQRLYYKVAGDATVSRELIGTFLTGGTGLDVDGTFTITVATVALSGTIQIPTGDGDDFEQSMIGLSTVIAGYTLYDSANPIADLQYTVYDGLSTTTAKTGVDVVSSHASGVTNAFEIDVNGETVEGNLNDVSVEEYVKSNIELFTAGDYTIINAEEYLSAKAANAMRIAIVHQTFANPDDDGAGTAKAYSGADVIIYDPYSDSGWSYYNPMNMAHEAYMGDMNGILLNPYYDATTSGIGRNAVEHDAAGKGTVTGTYEANKPTFMLKDTGSTVSGDHVYGARITIYIWIEGTDADCMNAISGYTILGQLSFTGAMPR